MGQGCFARKGVTNFVPVTFLRLINYKFIKLSHLYLPFPQRSSPPIFGYWVWAASLGKGSFVLSLGRTNVEKRERKSGCSAGNTFYTS